MLPVAHPEVLSPEWLPPVAIGRAAEWNALRAAVVSALEAGSPRGFRVVGARGSGTSTVARLAARAAVQELRGRLAGPPLLLPFVRAGASRGGQAVATELLQRLDPGFSGRGFRTTEILAGFLRRLRRASRPCVAVVDDLGPGAGDLAPFVRAFTEPDCFLPEGESGLPPLVLVLAGTAEATAVWRETVRRGWTPETTVGLPALDPDHVVRILRDRAQRALGRPAPEAWLDRLVGRLRAREPTPALAVEFLRRALEAPPTLAVEALGGGNPFRPQIEPPLLAALARVATHRQATVAEVRRWEAEFAEREGARPLPATTFWRRIVRLESAGVVHREVRAGGAGGTRSVVELLRPITVPSGPVRPDTPPAAGSTCAVPGG